jgi:hypothetical protein
MLPPLLLRPLLPPLLLQLLVCVTLLTCACDCTHS